MPLLRLIPLVLLAAAPAFLAAGPQAAAGLPGTVVSSVKVTVPQDNAELKVNGKVIEGSGKVREFKTEELKDGETYKYTFSAFWEPNNYTKITRTKTVSFVAGKDVVVDLSKPDPANPDAVVVRWVPTPNDIVDKMIEMAAVKDTDIVYEPGPGDGRILIAAAKKGAKKCVGIEFDPKKTAEGQENVKKAGLADRVAIRQGDALKVTDYGEATVIFLYMGEQFNLALRPLFEKQCKPGTRIVSHRFKMGDWQPDKTIPVTSNDDPGYETELHLWILRGQKK
jgi:uncharacterized protein (TIGR03000 family)